MREEFQLVITGFLLIWLSNFEPEWSKILEVYFPRVAGIAYVSVGTLVIFQQAFFTGIG